MKEFVSLDYYSLTDYGFQLCCPGVTDAKSYVILSQLPPNVYKKHVEDANTVPLSGFTFVVVSVVYLAGGKITEGMYYSLYFSVFITLK